MWGLVIKDFLNLKSYMKSIIFIIIIYGAVQIFNFNNNVFENLIPFIGTICCMNMFYYDESSKWGNYVLGFPIKKSKIVMARYISSLIIIFMLMIIAEIVVITASIVNKIDIEFYMFVQPFINSGACIFIVALFFPILYRFGVEKSAFMYMIFIGIAATIISVICSINIVGFNVGSLLKNSIYFIPVIAVLCLYISYITSVKLYGKKN